MSPTKPALFAFAFALALALPACSDDTATPPKPDSWPPGDCACWDYATPDIPATDLPASFACGDTHTCKAGEYCEVTIPGACGGNPVPDSGTCPPDCQPSTCGGSQQFCVCKSYGCHVLPAGCTKCSCFTPPNGCSCQDGAGGPFVSCAMP